MVLLPAQRRRLGCAGTSALLARDERPHRRPVLSAAASPSAPKGLALRLPRRQAEAAGGVGTEAVLALRSAAAKAVLIVAY